MITIGNNTKIKNSIIGRDIKKEKELQERIDKAIEYIENESYFMYKDNERVLDRVGIEKLLDILKGSDSNE